MNQCDDALLLIEPLYNSRNTDNAVRLAAASTYGCKAGISIFTLLGNIVTFPQSFAGSGFWEFMVQQFPSEDDPDDRKPVAGEEAIKALLSTIHPSTILLEDYTINANSNNPGSLIVADRLDDANSYLTFVGLALMGSLLYRYGQPLPNNHKSQALPWTDPTLNRGDGCAFASALLNFYDGIRFSSASASEQVAEVYNEITTFLDASLNAACDFGCLQNGCLMGCSTCPRTLRNPESCTGETTDVNSCAAAGLANFANTTWSGPP